MKFRTRALKKFWDTYKFVIIALYLIFLLKDTLKGPSDFIQTGVSSLKYRFQGYTFLFKDVKKPIPIKIPNNTFNILLLSSMGRSGSSFLGGLLSSLPGIFYFFEPLYNLEQWQMLNASVAIESIRNLLMCNMTKPVLTAMRDFGKGSFRHSYFDSCGTKKLCLMKDKLVRVCQSEPIRMVKTIRTRLGWLMPLFEDTNLNLRVIHILRDPRGSIISSIKAQWDITPERMCINLMEDLESSTNIMKLFPKRYLTIRYEDVCTDPQKTAEMIMNFLGYESVPPSTIKFLQRTTSADDPKGREYSIVRNSRYQQQKWRQVITQEDLMMIEEICAASIARLGFNLFGNLEVARNLNFPLFNSSSENIFDYF